MDEKINKYFKSKHNILRHKLNIFLNYLPAKDYEIYEIKENYLIFHDKFNDQINPFIIDAMKTVKKIIFGDNFNQSVDNIPDNIEKIEFGLNFDKSIDKLPYNLKTLIIGYNFNQSIDKLPPNLKTLKIMSKNLSINIDKLPVNLKKLIIFYDFSEERGNSSLSPALLGAHPSWDNDIDNLPKTLELLEIKNYNKPVNNLPKTLKYLILDGLFNQNIDNLPNGLLFLYLGEKFNQPIDNLPNSLIGLCLNGNFNQSIDFLPSSLRFLRIEKDGWCQKFDYNFNNIPHNLAILDIALFEDSINCNLLNLPSSLKCLLVGRGWNTDINKNNPEQIKVFKKYTGKITIIGNNTFYENGYCLNYSKYLSFHDLIIKPKIIYNFDEYIKPFLNI